MTRRSGFGAGSTGSMIGIVVGAIVLLVVLFFVYKKFTNPSHTAATIVTSTIPAAVVAAVPALKPQTFVGSFNTFLFYGPSVEGPWTPFKNGSQYLTVVNLGDGSYGGLSNFGNELNYSIPSTSIGTLNGSDWSRSPNTISSLTAEPGSGMNGPSFRTINVMNDKTLLGVGLDGKLYTFNTIYGDNMKKVNSDTFFFFATQIKDGTFLATDNSNTLMSAPALTGPWTKYTDIAGPSGNYFGMIQQLNDGSFVGQAPNVGVITASNIKGPWKRVAPQTAVDLNGNNVTGGFITAV